MRPQGLRKGGGGTKKQPIYVVYKDEANFFAKAYTCTLLFFAVANLFHSKAYADSGISTQLLFCSSRFRKNGQIFQTVQSEIINNVNMYRKIYRNLQQIFAVFPINMIIYLFSIIQMPEKSDQSEKG